MFTLNTVFILNNLRCGLYSKTKYLNLNVKGEVLLVPAALWPPAFGMALQSLAEVVGEKKDYPV